MKKIKPIISIIAVLVFISTAAFIHMIFDTTIYLPIVAAPKWTPSPTPTLTPTPSITPTPTATPKYDLTIVKIVNSDTMDPLNEYVSIYNNRYSTVDLTGWFIRDDGSNRYDFPTNVHIAGKKTIQLWTKAGQNTVTELYWGSAVEVWNDGGDCAYLRDDSDGEKILVDRYCYTTDEDGLMIIIQEP